MARMVRLSIISIAAGTMRRAIMPATAALAVSMLGNTARIVLTALGDRHQAHPDAGDDAQRALGADDQSHQVVARRVGGAAADLHHLAIGQHDFEPERVVGRHAVAQRVRSARVFADVATDRARLLARRIGHVRQSKLGDGLAEAQVDHAWLDDGPQIVDVDLEDPSHSRQTDEHAALRGDRAARQTRARAARRVRHAQRGGTRARPG